MKKKNAFPCVPQVAVGGIVIQNNTILLIKRDKNPSKGQWAIPGGSVKLGETLQKAVEREIREETGLIVKAKDPVYTFDLIERDHHRKILFHYVIIDLMTDLIRGRLRPSNDASDARWFTSEEVEEFEVTESTKEFLKKFRFILGKRGW